MIENINIKHTNTITLREATPQDAPLLRYWDEQPHNIAADTDDDEWDWETELNRNPYWGEQLMAELDGRPIGFLQIIDPAEEETHYWGDTEPHLRAIDIWIGEASDLNQGYGTVMMNMALERCFADQSVTAVIIDPLETNTKAHRFYERIGFRFIEKRIFAEGDECLIYRIERAEWQQKRQSAG